MKFSILIITREREEELLVIHSQLLMLKQVEDCEIIIVDNGSSDETQERLTGAFAQSEGTQLILLPENLGVSGGRNVALKASRGDIVIEIDDDAHIEDFDLLQRVESAFESLPEAGILACKIINYHSKKIVPMEYPFKNKSRDSDLPGYTSWYIGCCHAFRREVISRIGFYRDFFPWGSEEPDYSFRALNAGFKIHYSPELVVFHKKSEKARIENKTEFYSIALKNRIKMAALNLPVLNVLGIYFLRGAFFTIKHKNLLIWPKATVKLLRESKYLRQNRERISSETMAYIRSINGNLWR